MKTAVYVTLDVQYLPYSTKQEIMLWPKQMWLLILPLVSINTHDKDTLLYEHSGIENKSVS